jgi:hypothetical protein
VAFIYNMTVDDPKMTKDIIRVIDDQQDRQNHSTNVKAQMTEWKMQDQDGFRDLCYYIKNAVQQASLLKYKRDFNPFIFSMWGLKYKSSEYALEHNHYPATWSSAYYLNPPEGCPAIEFQNKTGEWFEVPVQHGLLLIFEGNTTHRVSKKEFVGDRYVVSSNIMHDFTQTLEWNEYEQYKSI